MVKYIIIFVCCHMHEKKCTPPSELGKSGPWFKKYFVQQKTFLHLQNAYQWNLAGALLLHSYTCIIINITSITILNFIRAVFCHVHSQFSSSVQFCEPDYLFSPYIAEFHNAWTSLCFCMLALGGLYLSNPVWLCTFVIISLPPRRRPALMFPSGRASRARAHVNQKELGVLFLSWISFSYRVGLFCFVFDSWGSGAQWCISCYSSSWASAPYAYMARLPGGGRV